MKSVTKEVALTTQQLSLDFEGRTPAQKKTVVKAPRVRKAQTGIDIPERPKG
jgi:hypothetical protein